MDLFKSLGGLVGTFGSIGASAVGVIPNLMSLAGGFSSLKDNTEQSSLGVGRFKSTVSKVTSELPSMSSIISFALSPKALGLEAAALGFWTFHDSATISFSDLANKIPIVTGKQIGRAHV